MQGTEAFAMVSTVAIIAGTIYGLARAFFNRPSKRPLPVPHADPMLQDRLDRLESAIQAIAIETERIAEGQRFTTKLLSQHGSPAAQPSAQPAAIALPSFAAEALPASAAGQRSAAR